ncbi:MAG: hypothetical protein Fur0016_08680 [Anaerolineales bacterium]
MSPSTQDRTLAVIAHLSALAFGSGVFVPAALWSENRRKSAYVRFQTLQALGYQSLGYTLWVLGALLLFIVFYIGLLVIALLVPNAAQNETILAVFSIAIVVMMFGLMGIYLFVPIIGAVLCGLGKDFHYPLLGGRLARSLGYQPEAGDNSPELDSAFEERFAAAMSHFAVILPLWGLLAPAWLWISHKSHSSWLKFQSAQTTLYQGIVNVLYFGLTFASVFIGFGSMALFAMMADLGEWTAMAGMMVMICLLGCTGLIVPLFHILGQWAGLQTLRGRDFKYPFLGGWVAKRISYPDITE